MPAATSAEVVLSAGDDVVLTVSDDGVGYQPGSAQQRGAQHGRPGRGAGRHLHVTGRDAGGTEVVWRVPARR